MLPLLTRDADFELGDAECKCRRRSMNTTLIPLCLLNRHWLCLFSPSVSAHSRANGGSEKYSLPAHNFQGPVPRLNSFNLRILLAMIWLKPLERFDSIA